MMEAVNWATALISGTVASATTLLLQYWLGLRSQKKQFAHRFQFEKEYAIYDALWAKVCAVTHTGRWVQVGHQEPNASEQAGKRALESFMNAWTEATDSIDKNRPFICREVIDALEELHDAVFQGTADKPAIAADVMGEGLAIANRTVESQKNVDRISDAIRDRIKQMEVRT